MNCKHEVMEYVGEVWFNDGNKYPTWQCRGCGFLFVELEEVK